MKKKGLLVISLFLSFVLTFSQSLNVLQVRENTYLVQLDSYTKKTKLEWSALPDSWKPTMLLTVKSNHDTLAIVSAHPILKLMEKKKGYYGAARKIELEGAINFRDLGGYVTKEGRQMKWGKIYRSADISKLTDRDLGVLSGLRIKMVCDLRGEKEVEAAPDRVPQDAERILLSAGSENIGGAGSFMKYMKSPERADSMIMGMYTRTDHLSKNINPCLINC